MEKHWLITWRTYGTWLPGDERGFVGNMLGADGTRVSHNIPGMPQAPPQRGLELYVREQMTGEPIALAKPEADALIAQYQETAGIRGWCLCAASVMFNHTHILIGVDGDPDPHRMRETLKSWATRAVKKLRPLPPNGSFWAEKGSVRRLDGISAVHGAVIYVVRRQPDPLAVYCAPGLQFLLDSDDSAAT